jgi:hypothetical protein
MGHRLNMGRHHQPGSAHQPGATLNRGSTLSSRATSSSKAAPSTKRHPCNCGPWVFCPGSIKRRGGLALPRPSSNRAAPHNASTGHHMDGTTRPRPYTHPPTCHHPHHTVPSIDHQLADHYDQISTHRDHNNALINRCVQSTGPERKLGGHRHHQRTPSTDPHPLDHDDASPRGGGRAGDLPGPPPEG